MRMNIDRLSPNRMQFFRIRFASFARPALPLSPPFFSRGTRGHACAQNRGTKPRRCMHRYSYLNCNLHSREDARETWRREKEGVRENTRILSGGKAVSFVGWLMAEGGTVECKCWFNELHWKTLQSFFSFLLFIFFFLEFLALIEFSCFGGKKILIVGNNVHVCFTLVKKNLYDKPTM